MEFDEFNHMPFDPSFKACGIDVRIDKNVNIKRPHLVSIGNHVAINGPTEITCAADIGDYVHVAQFVSAIGGERGYLYMGFNATLAAGCRIITVSDEHLGAGLVGPTVPDAQRDNLLITGVTLADFVNLGTNVVVMPGVHLNIGTKIGANSFVPANFVSDPWTLYVGSPVRRIGFIQIDSTLRKARELGYKG